MKKHAREALKAARRVAQLVGLDVVLLPDQTGSSHYRFAVIRADGTELGRFTLGESPRVASASANKARQAVSRLVRARA